MPSGGYDALHQPVFLAGAGIGRSEPASSGRGRSSRARCGAGPSSLAGGHANAENMLGGQHWRLPRNNASGQLQQQAFHAASQQRCAYDSWHQTLPALGDHGLPHHSSRLSRGGVPVPPAGSATAAASGMAAARLNGAIGCPSGPRCSMPGCGASGGGGSGGGALADITASAAASANTAAGTAAIVAAEERWSKEIKAGATAAVALAEERWGRGEVQAVAAAVLAEENRPDAKGPRDDECMVPAPAGEQEARAGSLVTFGRGTSVPPTSRVAAAAPYPMSAQSFAPPSQVSVGGTGCIHENVQTVSEYASDIYSLLFSGEEAYVPRSNYMESQVEINSKMRAILVDWLIEVHMKFRLRPETLFLTVNIMDRYLADVSVSRRRLQLVGVVSMLIAAKFEEIQPPEIGDYVYITDQAYTKDEILALECAMLSALSFEIVVPTPAHFIERLQRANRCDGPHSELAKYLVELALPEFRMIRYAPSHLAASALMLSNELVGRQPVWPTHTAHFARYSESSLRSCAEELRGLLEAAPSSSLKAVQKKYAAPEHHQVSRMFDGL